MKVPRLKINTPKTHPINNRIAMKYNRSLMAFNFFVSSNNRNSVPACFINEFGLFPDGLNLSVENWSHQSVTYLPHF